MEARPPPSSSDIDDHTAESPLPVATPHAGSQNPPRFCPTVSSSHRTPSLSGRPSATVNPDTNTSPPESPVIRPQQSSLSIDRWEASSSAETTRWSTSERLGDHAATRYRNFQQFVDSKGDELDNELFGMLLSGESLCDEIRAFEKASSLVRLAQTGYLVHKLQQLHELLDSVTLTYAMVESEDLSSWKNALEAERADRVERYHVLLKVRLVDDDEEGSTDVELDLDNLDDWDLTDETFVKKVLTMLMVGVKKYAYDVLTQQETQTITAAFEAVSMHSNIVVFTTPEWLVSPFEFGGTYGLGRWGNDLRFPDFTDSERFVVEANIWYGLNHPHIAKFLGACHVGSRPFFAHEKVRTLTEYLGALKVTDRQAVWCRLYELALGVRYVHERGLGCGELGLDSVYCARFEDKTLLLGVGLVKSGRKLTDVGVEYGVRANVLTKLVRADIRSLFLCILDAFRVLASSQEDEIHIVDDDTKELKTDSDRTLPTSRPECVTVDEWDMLQPMFSGDSEVNMLVVLDRLGSLAGNEERDAFDDMTSIDKQLNKEVIDLGNIVVLSNGLTLREVLEQCEQLVAHEPSCAQIQTRLSNVWDEVQCYDLIIMDSNEAKDMVGHMCSLIVRFYRFLYQKSTSAASSLAGWNRRKPAALFSFHSGIDYWIKQYGKSNEVSTIHDWQPAWHQLQASRQSLLVESQLVAELSNDDEEETYCEFERTHHRAMHSTKTNPSNGSTLGRCHEPFIDVPKQSSLPRWLIPPYEVDFREFDTFGEGSFGTVHRGRWFETPVVVKRVCVDVEDKRAVRQQFRREADIWFGLNHINVIKMYGACHVGQPFFVCEYANGGELMAFLEREGRNPSLVWYSLLNAALGLQYLHDAGVVHGDLKANNILVGADRNVKLADFGLSLSTSARSSQDAAGGAVGAYRWKAPECIPYKDDLGQSPTFASDVYSFAMCIIEVVSGEFPWERLPDVAVKYQVKNGKLPKRPANLDDAEWDLIERMCCFDPTKRVTIGMVVTHLSALLQRMDMEQLWLSIREIIPFINRVMSRDGALLSLLKLVMNTNPRLAKLAQDHLIAVHVNRNSGSNRRELEMIVNMLLNDHVNVKKWAVRAVIALCWKNDFNSRLIGTLGGVPALLSLILVGADDQKDTAVGALGSLSVNADNKVIIAAEGGITVLLNLIRDGTERPKERAASVLGALAVNAENRVTIAKEGGIAALLALTKDGTEGQKEYAARAIANLSVDGENKVIIAAEEGIPVLLDLIRDGTDLQKVYIAGAIRSLALNAENRVTIAAEGGISLLLDLVRVGNGEQKEHAVIAIKYLALNAENRVTIAAEGGISLLLDLFRVGNGEQKEHAVIAIKYLALNAENRVTIAAEGGISLLLDLFRVGNGEQKEHAVIAIKYLALNAENRVTIAALGGITVLLDLIRDGTDLQKENGTTAIAYLALNAENRVTIAAEGGLPALLNLLRDGTEGQKENAAAAIRNMSLNAENRESIADEGGILTLLNLIRVGSNLQKENAAEAIRNLLVNAENRVPIVEEETIQALINLIYDGTDNQKESAAGAIANLSVIVENRVTIAAKGGIHVLLDLIRDGTDLQKEYSAAAIQNLALNDGMGYIIVNEGGIPFLLNLLRDGTEGQKEYAALSIRNLSVNVENKVTIAATGGIPVLLHLIRDGNDFQREIAVSAIANIAVNSKNKTTIAKEGGIPVVLDLIHYGTSRQKEEAAAALWNLSANANTEDIVNSDGIPALMSLVRSGNEKHLENAVGVLWNLAYYCDTAKPIIKAHGGVELLLQIVTTGASNVQANAAGVLAFLDVNDDEKAVVIAHGGVSALLKDLEDIPIEWKDEILVALMSLCAGGGANVRSSFEAANGVAILSVLLSSDIDRVRDLSRRILSEVGYAPAD